MQTVGNITGYVDVAQLLLYAFWIFFAGLIYYLARESHREGYPMESSNPRAVVKGFPIPERMTFLLEGGRSVTVPDLSRGESAYKAAATGGSSGDPITPTGNPMLAGVGAGAYTLREDVPEMTSHGTPLLQPLRIATDYSVAPQDVDPRGLPVTAGDGKNAGTVKDIWIDAAEMPACESCSCFSSCCPMPAMSPAAPCSEWTRVSTDSRLASAAARARRTRSARSPA